MFINRSNQWRGKEIGDARKERDNEYGRGLKNQSKDTNSQVRIFYHSLFMLNFW